MEDVFVFKGLLTLWGYRKEPRKPQTSGQKPSDFVVSICDQTTGCKFRRTVYHLHCTASLTSEPGADLADRHIFEVGHTVALFLFSYVFVH